MCDYIILFIIIRFLKNVDFFSVILIMLKCNLKIRPIIQFKFCLNNHINTNKTVCVDLRRENLTLKIVFLPVPFLRTKLMSTIAGLFSFDNFILRMDV